MAAIVLGICIVLAAAQTLQAWPQDAGWWQQEVWWQSELAREGMGMMIVTVVLLVVALTLWRVRRGGAAPA
jgi:heme/copper-type cytochrome/quinol oxidase subunit 2